MEQKKTKRMPVSSFHHEKSIGECVFDHSTQELSFAINTKKGTDYKKSHKVGQIIYVPLPQASRLVTFGTLKLPEQPLDYQAEALLIKKIQSFIHRYVDLSDTFEIISTYYVLLTWLYDQFNELPYLRVRGDYGSGKTRFLTVLGSICYKPIFASGASTTAPIFHLLNTIKGTLILDESDFRYSDSTAEITKILNNGNAKGFSVLRCEQLSDGKFSARAYAIFGPKIIASRESFSDHALESRFITEDMGGTNLRFDIPITLPDTFEQEAQELRNMLLQYRFDQINTFKKKEWPQIPELSGRTQQIHLPLLSLVSEPTERAAIEHRITTHEDQLRSDRGLQVEAELLRVIQELVNTDSPLSLSQITKTFMIKYGQRYKRRITPKWIGFLLRSKLHLATQKSSGVYIISEGQDERLNSLYQKFDVV